MKPLLEQDFYALLEIEPGAGENEVAGALERARALWTDESGPTYSLLPDRERRALVGRLEEAGRVLLDPAGRVRYHESLGLAPPRPPARPKLVRLPGPHQREPAAAGAPSPKLPARQPTINPPVSPAAPKPPGAPEPPQKAQAPEPDAGGAGAPPPPPVRPDPSDFFHSARDARGENFRRYREACGVDLKDMARQTRIARMHLENIEADAYARLPALVYLRGFLDAYCRYLKLEPAPLVRGYLEHLAQFLRLREPT